MSKQALPLFLEGITILDVTNVLSGPFAGYLLALMGARVIKIEHPQRGDLARSLGASQKLRDQKMGSGFLAQNAGKESVAVDLKRPEGKEIFYKLVAGSDVVLENFRPGVMARLGLDYETLVAHQSNLIYCALSGYGQDGPEAGKPVYDQIIQGKSGLMDATGTDTSGPLRCGIPIADTVGGLWAALAVVLGLFHRDRTGCGHFIDISLLEAIMPMMGWVASNYFSAGIEPRRMGNENATAAPSGVFKTGSGLLNIAANTDEQWRRLCRALNIVELLEDDRFKDREARRSHRQELTAILEPQLASRPAAEWEEFLSAEGIPCGQVLSFFQALHQPQIQDRGLLTTLESQVLGMLHIFGLPAKFDHVSARVPPTLAPPPFLGEHTCKILKELDYSQERIAELTRSGVIFCHQG